MPTSDDDLPSAGDFTKSLQTLELNPQSEIVWDRTRKEEVWKIFVKCTGKHFAATTTKTRAFVTFLLFLADHGGSEEAASRDPLTVIVRSDTGDRVKEVGESYNTIISDLRELRYYTNHRMLASFCEVVSEALNAAKRLTVWGSKRSIPRKYCAYSYPGAEHNPNISDEASAALSFAKALALFDTSSGAVTTHFAGQSKPASKTVLSIGW